MKTLSSNIASLNAQRRLRESTSSLRQSFDRLSSGLRINKASDDAAGLSISASLKADSRILNQGVRNLNDGLSVLSIADGALEQLSVICTRLRELSTQAVNGTFSSTQRRSLDEEAQSLAKEYNRIARTTSFNGANILDGTASDTTLQAGYSQLAFNVGGGVGDGTFQTQQAFATGSVPYSVAVGDFNGDGVTDLVSADSGSSTASVLLGNGDGSFQPYQALATGAGPFSVTVGDFNGDGVTDLASAGSGPSTVSVRLGNALHGVSALQSFSLTTRDGAKNAMTYFARVGTTISSQRGIIGAFESRIQCAISTLLVSSEEFTAAEGRIVDADVAEESAALLRGRILQQAGAAVLSSSNQQPSLVLKLLGAE